MRGAASVLKTADESRPALPQTLTTQADTFCDWMPRVSADTTRLASHGSSPRYSKLAMDAKEGTAWGMPGTIDPLAAPAHLRVFHGTRTRLTPGPSMTVLPFANCSLPMASPKANANAVSQVWVTVRADGQHVTCTRR